MNQMQHHESGEAVQSQYVTMPLCDRTAVTELSGDYTLPDYQPEIRRLLYVGGRVLPPAKYVGGGNVELDGTMDYQILYVGADGGLYSAPLSGEYGISVPLENQSDFDLNEGVCVFATLHADSVTARVSAPRKLTIRCRLKSRIRAYGKMPLGERFLGEAEKDSICRKIESASAAELMSGRSDVISLSEEILENTENLRVIFADAGAFVHDVGIEEDSVVAKGEVLLKLLCATENDETKLITRKLPFEGMIETEEFPAGGMQCCVFGSISDLTVNVEEEKILCDVNMILETQFGMNQPLSYATDLFSTEQASRCAYREMKVPVLLRSMNGNLSQSERLERESIGLAEGTSIVDLYGNVAMETCEYKDGKYLLMGQSRYALICEKDGEYFSTELSLPVRYEMEGKEEQELVADVLAQVVSCRGKINGNTLELDSELVFTLSLLGSREIRTVGSVEWDEKTVEKSEDMILCYPSSEDTLWSIAKRYMVTPESISGDPVTDAYVVVRN